MSLPLIIKDIENRLKLSGGKIDGNLFLNGSVSKYSSGDQNYIHFLKGNVSQGYLGVNGEDNPVFISADATTIYDLYGEHNKPTAADVGALSLNGGTLNGDLYTSTAGSGKIGQSGAPWAGMYSRNFYLYDDNYINSARIYVSQSGTESLDGRAVLTLGNESPLGTLGNARGWLRLYDTSQYYANIVTGDGMTASITLKLPKISSTFANMKENYFDQKNLIFDLSAYSTGNANYNLKTWKAEAGKIIFRPEAGGAQDIYFIPTQYDNVYSGAGIVIAGPQGNEYLWSTGPLITNNRVVFHKRYDTAGAPKTAGAINGDRVLEYIHNPNNEIDTSPILTVYAPADVNGICPVLGGGGATIVSAGESYSSFPNTGMIEDGFAANNEHLFLTADGAIHMYVNCNTIANRKKISITTAGALVVPTNTDYTTQKARNIAANTSLSTPANGEVFLVYT